MARPETSNRHCAGRQCACALHPPQHSKAPGRKLPVRRAHQQPLVRPPDVSWTAPPKVHPTARTATDAPHRMNRPWRRPGATGWGMQLRTCMHHQCWSRSALCLASTPIPNVVAAPADLREAASQLVQIHALHVVRLQLKINSHKPVHKNSVLLQLDSSAADLRLADGVKQSRSLTFCHQREAS